MLALIVLFGRTLVVHSCDEENVYVVDGMSVLWRFYYRKTWVFVCSDFIQIYGYYVHTLLL